MEQREAITKGGEGKEDEEEISFWRFIHLTAIMFCCMG
jgi:hypothetical protein